MRTLGNRAARLLLAAAVAAGLSASHSLAAGLFDTLKGFLGPGGGEGGGSGSALTTGEISRGLLEALEVGAGRAVSRASAAGGFLDNPKIRIPLPRGVQSVATTLRAVGLGQDVDDFERTLNTGAERAASRALPIFGDAIKGLTFQDVERIWKGGESAATRYLREKTGDRLFETFLPVVHAASQEVGVTRAYQSLTDNAIARTLVSKSDLDLDQYVTGKALDGVFTLLAEEEKKIRTDPVARTTELLKKVFSQP